MSIKLENCPCCGAPPGIVHNEGCDIERCSECGSKWYQCKCGNHDPSFSRWTGLFPGEGEAKALGICFDEFMSSDIYKKFFIKPDYDIDEKEEKVNKAWKILHSIQCDIEYHLMETNSKSMEFTKHLTDMAFKYLKTQLQIAKNIIKEL